MNDEIKEILEEIDNKIIPNEHWNKIKYYITNLQNENERLKTALNGSKETTKKVIEYINEVKDKYYRCLGEDDGDYDTYLSDLEIEKVLKLLGGDK